MPFDIVGQEPILHLDEKGPKYLTGLGRYRVEVLDNLNLSLLNDEWRKVRVNIGTARSILELTIETPLCSMLGHLHSVFLSHFDILRLKDAKLKFSKYKLNPQELERWLSTYKY